MLVTPEKIKILQRKLYTKAKQEPGYRFYALYDKVYQADILQHAYKLVRSDGGSPGNDGVSFKSRGREVSGRADGGSEEQNVPTITGASSDDTQIGWKPETVGHTRNT